MSAGTTPPGARGEAEAAAWVQRMFARVAPRYDLLNRLLSFNIDRSWRKALVRAVQPDIARPGARVLDLCCGTGDVIVDLRAAGAHSAMGADFCHPMLVAADRKIANALLFEADALTMPSREASFDVITISFGFRNFGNYARGLAELHRVLRPGGLLAILEFSHPSNAFVRTSYNAYSRYFMPWLGAIISGSRDAYTYLPESIAKFPNANRLGAMMSGAGFQDVQYKLLSFGIAALHTARKSAAGG